LSARFVDFSTSVATMSNVCYPLTPAVPGVSVLTHVWPEVAVLRRSCKCSKAALNHAHQRIRELETTSAAMAERTAFATERANMLEMQLIEIHCGPRVAATERRGQLGL
jgi:hypothetical protein